MVHKEYIFNMRMDVNYVVLSLENFERIFYYKTSRKTQLDLQVALKKEIAVRVFYNGKPFIAQLISERSCLFSLFACSFVFQYKLTFSK